MSPRHANAPAIDLPTRDEPWREAASEAWIPAAFPELTALRTSRCAPEIHGVRLGEARLLSIRSQGALGISSLPHLAPPGCAVLVVQFAGSSVLLRGANVMRLQPGQLAIEPGDPLPFAIESEGPAAQLLLNLPLGLLSARYPSTRPLFRTYEADAAGVAPLRDLLLRAVEGGARLDALQRDLTLSAIVQMIGVAALSHPPASTNEWLAMRAVSAIEAHLHDPQLSARSVAEKLGMSRRHLDEVLHQTLGSTLSARILETRLARAAERLRMSDGQQESVTQIAFAVGFQDAAHFSRAFKARFGLTPRAWRSGRPAASIFGKSDRH